MAACDDRLGDLGGLHDGEGLKLIVERHVAKILKQRLDLAAALGQGL